MKIHADLSLKAVEHASRKEWIVSPSPGVFRKMLDRDGEEVARATSLVRYDPDSHFPRHTHGGGEEFLVLEGVFSDEHADYRAGTYVRNPIGSSHAPFVKPGCVIMVKLRQMTDSSEVWDPLLPTFWSLFLAATWGLAVGETILNGFFFFFFFFRPPPASHTSWSIPLMSTPTGW